MLEGSWTILAGLVSMFILPKSLEAARFFTEEERLFAGMFTQSLHHTALSFADNLHSSPLQARQCIAYQHSRLFVIV